MSSGDSFYQSKVYHREGGNEMVIANGGTMTVEDGAVVILNLPTADPHVAGQAWNSSGTVTVSQG